MKQAGSCSNCARGMKVSINRDILCKIHGIVSRDFRCSKYIRRVDKWSSSEFKPKCIECEFFISSSDKRGLDSVAKPESAAWPETAAELDAAVSEAAAALESIPVFHRGSASDATHDSVENTKLIGYCQLFTVRQFNGELKTACSKFSRKTGRKV